MLQLSNIEGTRRLDDLDHSSTIHNTRFLSLRSCLPLRISPLSQNSRRGTETLERSVVNLVFTIHKQVYSIYMDNEERGCPRPSLTAFSDRLPLN